MEITEIEIIINKFAQDMVSANEIQNWFNKLDIKIQKHIISIVSEFIKQTHPNQETIDNILNELPIKSIMTPVVLLKTKPLNIALNKIVNLPVTELYKTFTTLIHLFKITDTIRRETQCINGCTHPWHNLDN